MTAEELCAELACPPETPAGGLLAAWERRRAELDAALQENHPRPVKLRLREELRRLDDAETLTAGLKRAAEAEGLLAEFRKETGREKPSPAVLRLCLEKAQPLIAEIDDGALRFAAEKTLAECAEELEARAAPPSPAPAPAPAPRSEAAAGCVLELRPVPTGETLRDPIPAYRIVAKDTFSIGRLSGCDCVARYALDTEENRHRLSTISRVQTSLFSRGGQIYVQDGAGESAPSRNGTIIDEHRVTGPLPLNFAKERRFTLGQFGYEIRVQYFSEGFVRFLLPPAAGRSIQPIWLLSAAAVGASPTAALRLDAAYPPLVARILCRNNTRGASFFLETQKNHVSHVAINGTSCAPGSTVALQDAQLLQLGSAAFTLSIS